MGQIEFESRYGSGSEGKSATDNLNKNVIDITKSGKIKRERNAANKCIYKVKDTDHLKVHSWKGKNKEHLPRLDEIWFNHYKINWGNDNNKEHIFNIDRKIKRNIRDNKMYYII